MLFQLSLLLVLAACARAEIVPDPRVIEPPIRVDMPPPAETARLSARNVFQTFISMPVDHFNPQNSDTFLMVCSYLINNFLLPKLYSFKFTRWP